MADPLIPNNDEGTDPDLTLSAAIASLEAAAIGPALEQLEPPVPFGRTALFDFDTGRFVRSGGRPVWVTGHEALKQWVLMALNTERFAHPVFTDAFGMEGVDSVIGHAADVREITSDLGERIAAALLVHDRIVAVEDYSAHYDDAAGIFYIDSLTVVTDEDGRLAFQQLTLGSING